MEICERLVALDRTVREAREQVMADDASTDAIDPLEALLGLAAAEGQYRCLCENGPSSRVDAGRLVDAVREARGDVVLGDADPDALERYCGLVMARAAAEESEARLRAALRSRGRPRSAIAPAESRQPQKTTLEGHPLSTCRSRSCRGQHQTRPRHR